MSSPGTDTLIRIIGNTIQSATFYNYLRERDKADHFAKELEKMTQIAQYFIMYSAFISAVALFLLILLAGVM